MRSAVLVQVEKFVGRHPLLLSLSALLVSLLIEILQAWPAMIPLGHEFGEVVRNLGYAVAAAFAFNWIMIEVPRKREERRVLDAYWTNLCAMASAAEALLDYYRELAPEGHYNTTTWAGVGALLKVTPVINSSTGKPIIDDEFDEKIRTDPFAGTNIRDHVERQGQLISPFLHRLEPEVVDAVTELIHFPVKVDLRPLIHVRTKGSGPVTMAREFRRIAPFLMASSRVRQMLTKYYPDRRIKQTYSKDEGIGLMASTLFEYNDEDLE